MADPEDASAQRVVEMLRNAEFICTRARSGEEALAALHEGFYDLVLLVVDMPGLNGYDTCRRLRLEIDLPPTPVILLGGDRRQVIHGFEQGADDFIGRPYDTEEFLARVKAQHFRDGQGTSGNPVFEQHSFQKLHRNEGALLVPADLIDRTDIRMVQGGRRARFPPKSIERLAICRQFVGQKFKSDKPAQFQILRFVNDTHTATANFLENAVVGNRLANHENKGPRRWLEHGRVCPFQSQSCMDYDGRIPACWRFAAVSLSRTLSAILQLTPSGDHLSLNRLVLPNVLGACSKQAAGES